MPLFHTKDEKSAKMVEYYNRRYSLNGVRTAQQLQSPESSSCIHRRAVVAIYCSMHCVPSTV